ncbi:MAG: hypothetical protein E7082_00235 [Bacteroidales bacterium]|nr:hypothetical protein [Bacteroidales bacterium]
MNIKNLFFAIIALVLIVTSSVSSTAGVNVPKFPYQNYIDAIETDSMPEISDNDFGYNPICPHIRYLELPQALAGNVLADSLMQFYNMALACNAFTYDIGTALRYINEDGTSVMFADAFESFNLEGVKNDRIRKLLQLSARNVAEELRKGESLAEASNDDFGAFLHEFKVFTDNLFMKRYTDEKFAPYYVLCADYYDLHDKALAADSLNFRGELLQLVLNEKDPMLQGIYECAYSNYVSKEIDNMEVIAVFDMLLRGDKYSPLLRDLWRIWRVILQKDMLGGMSNDSPMYNLFYNDMRNRVALTIIKHIVSDPEEDYVAFMEFVKLGLAENINRHSGVLVGSNVVIEDMELLYNHIQ